MNEQELRIKISTVAELRAMKELERSLISQITAARAAGRNFDELAKQLAGVQSRMGNMSGMSRFTAELGLAAEKIPGMSPVIEVLSGKMGLLAAGASAAAMSLREYAGAQEVIYANDAALAQTGQLTDEYRQRLQDLASQLQETTSIADEEWLGVLTRLTQFGAKPENIEQYAEAVKNLAGLMGGDIQGAAQAFSRAMQGNFTVFSRYGIRVAEAGTATEKLNQLMQDLALRGGSQLEARAQSLTGQWRRLKNGVGDILEGFGRLIVTMTPLVPAIEGAGKAAGYAAMLFGGVTPKLAGLENAAVTTTQSLDDLGEAGKTAGEKTGTAADQIAEKYKAAAEAIEKARRAQDEMADAVTAKALAEVDAEEAKLKAKRDLTPSEEAGFRVRRASLKALGEQSAAESAADAAAKTKRLAEQRLAEEAGKIGAAQGDVQWTKAGVGLAAQGAGLSEQKAREVGGDRGTGFNLLSGQIRQQIKDAAGKRQELAAQLAEAELPGQKNWVSARAPRIKAELAALDQQVEQFKANAEKYEALAAALRLEAEARDKVAAAEREFGEKKKKLESDVTESGAAAEVANIQLEAAAARQRAAGFNATAARREARQKEIDQAGKPGAPAAVAPAPLPMPSARAGAPDGGPLPISPGMIARYEASFSTAAMDRSVQIVNQGLERIGGQLTTGWQTLASTVARLERKVATLDDQAKNARSRRPN